MTENGDYYTADEIRQRLSISTLVFQGFRSFSEQALQQLAENNITRIELVESRDQYDLGDIRSHASSTTLAASAASRWRPITPT